MDYESAIQVLLKGSPRGGSKLGLVRMQALMAQLGNPQDQIPAIHIAGTNGKGSVSAMLTEILSASGYKVGCYTSPSMEQFNDRIRIGTQTISDEELMTLADEMHRRIPDSLTPTEFEWITAAAFLYFQQQQCDILVVEVGLGGRLDATNVISKPLLSVITSIGLDHQEILGDTVEKIAWEKAGILKPGCPLISAKQKPAVLRVLRARALALDCHFEVSGVAQELSFDQKSQNIRYHQQTYVLSLRGINQLENAAVAINCSEYLQQLGLHISDANIHEGLLSVRWPGRFEVLGQNPDVVIDGAHNEPGFRSLAANLMHYYPRRRVIAMVGVLADKDYRHMFTQLMNRVDVFICVDVASQRALQKEMLADYLHEVSKAKILIAESAEDAWRMARAQCNQQQLIIGTGSLYFISDLRLAIRASSANQDYL